MTTAILKLKEGKGRRDIRVHTGFLWGNLKETNRSEERHKWENNIKLDLQETGCEDISWINLAQDRDRWRAVVNAIMNLRAVQNTLNLLTAFQERLYSLELEHEFFLCFGACRVSPWNEIDVTEITKLATLLVNKAVH
jgi:hypothetical protein